ncbi:ABC transporter ATP-binding protein [Paracoccus shanxieyensis]|uniref:Glutathione import ATP-binding protein GsiA n=1 Tax=Paracoccus shanxieyensis TaxID=2675752 RepID=A0A6L6IT50_9RHOB|nr:ABC transporter ATP-binding protein [Paracoccus shanxieyensis]MTH63685.1 dipeptide ABC transporter ATP-binding protein [Paracoccus shanxieyensis]MTH86804.1 dipeptide ABC transporter ATP-binding protein [Paracoccus shanxieyensis]
MTVTQDHTTARQPLLRVRDLTVGFRRDGQWGDVVRKVGFGVDPGETLAVVGESGSGKSVTSMALMQLLPRDGTRVSGQVLFRGTDLLTLDERQMQRIRGNRISMIFQEPMTSLNPVMTIGAQIAESILMHRRVSPAQARAEALAMMDRVRIPSAKSRYDDFPHQFSGGMRQRVMIAAALACQPELLIADEPTTALDVTIQAQVLDLIKELQAESGMGVIFITHDMGVVAEVSDRTLVMYHGDAVETGTTPQIFDHPAQTYTRALLSAVPRLGSMAGQAGPVPYPVFDMASGQLGVPEARPDTLRADAPSLLEVSDLSKRFVVESKLLKRTVARVHAVEGVSFTLRRGETLSIVGESGCGKSTTGKLVTGLHPRDSGRVMLDGRELSTIPVAQRAHDIQMIFQDPYASLNPRLRVGDAITEPLRIHGSATAAQQREIAAQLLLRVGLKPEMASRYPHEFSGGQRQRICVARALVMKPKVIVADEAVSALDVTMKTQVVNLMMDLQQEMGLGFVFISHDMAVVERISHRIAVMYLGEIVEIGPRAAIFEDPRHPYTRRLLSAVPVPDPARRHQRAAIAASELRSPVRAPDYRHPVRQYTQISDDHFVLETGADWQ